MTSRSSSSFSSSSSACMLLLAVISLAICLSDAQLNIAINDATGDYTVQVDGQTWLVSGATGIYVNNQWYLSDDGTLVLLSTSQYSSADVWGTYQATSFDWQADNTSYVTTIKVYTATSLIVFDQYFPDGAYGTQLGTTYDDMDRPMCMFPRFQAAGGLVPVLGTYTIKLQWRMDVSMKAVGLAGTEGGLYSGMPLVFYDQNTLNSLVMSSANNFKSAVAGRPTQFDGDLAYGVQGRVMSLPLRYRQQTMMYYSGTHSINAAVTAWGDLLLLRYAKARYDPREIAPHRSFLSYYTDTGAFYWYYTIPGLNYEETMLALKASHQGDGIPVRVYELDSWWYYHISNSTDNPPSSSGGIYLYEPRPDVFPSGMEYIVEQLGTPLITHAKFFAPNNVYSQRYPFLEGTSAALPLTWDTWEEISNMIADWGVNMLKQDWLESTYEFLLEASYDVSTARNYLAYLGSAINRAGICLQYCMPQVGDIMASVDNPAARSLRISGDYSVEAQQWKYGQHAIYAWALGLAPFKDVFWTTSWQSDFPQDPDFFEVNPELQACVSTLSTAGVGFGDKVDNTNVTVLRMTCADDGTILSPDKPATVIDSWFLAQGGPQGGEVWHTYTHLTVGNLPDEDPADDDGAEELLHPDSIFHYIFSFNLTSPYDFQITDPVLPASLTAVPFQYYAFNFHAIDGISPWSVVSGPLTLPASAFVPSNNHSGPFNLFIAAQQMANGWTLLGEVGKFVPISALRFENLLIQMDNKASKAMVSVAVNGAAGEVVVVRWLTPDGVIVFSTCSFPGTPPAWWGTETTSLNLQLISACNRGGVCNCDATGSVPDYDDEDDGGEDGDGSKKDDGLSDGEVAGAVVGGIVGAGVIGFVAFKLMRPKKGAYETI